MALYFWRDRVKKGRQDALSGYCPKCIRKVFIFMKYCVRLMFSESIREFPRRRVTRYFIVEYLFYTLARILTRAFLGKRRRFLLPYLRSLDNFLKAVYPKKLLRIVKIDDVKFAVFRDSYSYVYIALLRERKRYRHLIESIKEEGIKTFIDVGANIGAFALRIARKFSEVNVIAIEPAPENAYLLRTSAAVNKLQNLHVIEAAAWHEETELLLRLSLDPSTHTVLEKHPVREHPVIGTLRVKAVTLDKIAETYGVKGPVLVKVDVEGAEISVLKGASALLNKYETIVHVDPHLREHRAADDCDCTLCRTLMELGCVRVDGELNVWRSKPAQGGDPAELLHESMRP